MVTKKLILVLIFIGVAAAGGAGYWYYRWVYLPKNEQLTPQQAREKWLQIVANRGGQRVIIGGHLGDGGIEDFRVLEQCFIKGEPAENVAAILATGEKVTEFGHTSYRWWFITPKPKHPDATHRLFEVAVSAKPPIIEWFAWSDSVD